MSRLGRVRGCTRAEQAPAAPVTLPDTAPETIPDFVPDEWAETDRPWITIVWNDPVNLMTYVVYVFQKVFGYSLEKSTELMRQVHVDGKAVVSSGTRDQMEIDVKKLHAHGLWATLQKDD